MLSCGGSATDESGDGISGLPYLCLGLIATCARSLDHAVPEVVVHQQQRQRLQGSGGGRDLSKHINAIGIFVDHPLQSPDLPLNPPQPSQVLLFIRRIADSWRSGHQPMIPPRGILGCGLACQAGHMTDLRGAHILLIGASGGLGSQLARALADKGARLTLSGRSQSRLSALAEQLQQQFPASDPAVIAATLPREVEQLIQAAAARGPLTGVVFAAGVVAFGPIQEVSDDTIDDLLLINTIAPMRVIRQAAPVLPRGGFIAVLSGVVAERPLPGMAAYCAAKAATAAFVAGAAIELRRQGVRLIDIRPPHTETGLADRPIAGQAPTLPPGLAAAAVAERIVQALADDERELPSAAFN
jgi:short-subunit dehydrogenase